MKKIIVILSAMLVALSAVSANIEYKIQSVIFSETTDWGDLEVTFVRCGNNNIYTFSTVSLDGVEVNHTRSSNNIGGFLADGWWMGGNHNDGKPNARTMNVTVKVDGVELPKKRATVTGKVLTIDVENDIYFADEVKFCTEKISYRVSGNSIEVSGHHDYCYPRSLNVEKYYPMQSVFVDETEILTPGGLCRTWTELEPVSEGKEVEFTRASAPDFCTFVEHGKNGYQAVYLAREGLGNREWIDDNDVVFIGNSWGKSYHKCIGDYSVSGGQQSDWHGVYSWFRKPLTDNCHNESDDLTFEYGAYIDGEPVVMHLGSDGTMSQTTGINDVICDALYNEFACSGNGFISISGTAPEARCFNASGALIHVGAGKVDCLPGFYIVDDAHGHALKLLVK